MKNIWAFLIIERNKDVLHIFSVLDPKNIQSMIERVPKYLFDNKFVFLLFVRIIMIMMLTKITKTQMTSSTALFAI